MRRILIVMAFVLITVVSATAQDRIFFNDSRIVNAVIDQVGSPTIQYRLYSNPDGPVRSAATESASR